MTDENKPSPEPAKDFYELSVRLTGECGDGVYFDHEKAAALIQSSFEAWQAAEQTALDEPGYWWCPECEEEVTSTRVTFQECHDTCGRHVIWKEPIAALRAAQERIKEMEAKTVPMEMLWRIAGEGLAANGGRRVDEAKLRGIAAKYGYKVEEGSS